MNVFEVVKENVTARQAAEAYGLKVGPTGMACCPFHSDKSPSMKLDERYYCFGCGATGDAVDLTAKLFGIGLREAAVKLAEDFGLNYDSRQKPSVRPRIREPTPEQKYQKALQIWFLPMIISQRLSWQLKKDVKSSRISKKRFNS